MAKSIAKKTAKAKTTALVAVVMGSTTDSAQMNAAQEVLDQFGISSWVRVLSAHRTPEEVADFAKSAAAEGFKVIIAGAGGAAHLPGLIASHTHLPVIGVPISVGPLQGVDALYSIVQMPRGIPVATVAIGNSWNAGVLAAQILATSDEALAEKLQKYKEKTRQDVLAKS